MDFFMSVTTGALAHRATAVLRDLVNLGAHLCNRQRGCSTSPMFTFPSARCRLKQTTLRRHNESKQDRTNDINYYGSNGPG